MTLTSADIKVLVRIVGRHGACVALSHSHKIRAQELLDTADSLGISLPRRTPKAEVAVAIVKYVDRRVDRSVEELKQLSVDDILQYLNQVNPDTDEVVDLLRSIGIEHRVMSRRSLLEFAANEISSLGVFERIANPPRSKRSSHNSLPQKSRRRATLTSMRREAEPMMEDGQTERHASIEASAS